MQSPFGSSRGVSSSVTDAITSQLELATMLTGSYYRPFASDSPWNTRVVNPYFGTYVIPADIYKGSVQASTFSAEFVAASLDDGPLTFYPTLGTPVTDGTNPAINTAYGTNTNLTSITLPRVPATFNVAAGTDGHIDIFDPATGYIHSLWQAKRGSLSATAVTNGGSGYTPNSTTIPVTVLGDGTGATARAVANSSGVITSVVITLTGANYTYATLVIGGTGTGATATATVDTLWRCYQYNWCHISDTGFGDRGRYYKGARAAGTPTCAGVIRRHEVDDGEIMFRHALTMSMTYSGLSPTSPGFVFPATAADATYNLNTGQIPEGARMMIPSDFDVNSLNNLFLRKIVRTMQTYGSFVCDRNVGTPFIFYVEGVDGWFNIKEYSTDKYIDGNGDVQSPTIFAEMDKIQAAMRQVVGFDYLVDAEGKIMTNYNRKIRLSNGISSGTGSGTAGVSMKYDSVTDEVLITGVSGAWTFTQTNPPLTGVGPDLKPFTTYKLEIDCTSGVTVTPSMNVTGGGPRIGSTATSTGVFTLHRTGGTISNQSVSYSYTGSGAGPHRVRVRLTEIDETTINAYPPKWVGTPTISAAVNGVLCTPTNTCTSSGSITYTYQWWKNGANISAGAGGTAESYTPQPADVGATLYRTAVATANGYKATATTTTNTVTIV